MHRDESVCSSDRVTKENLAALQKKERLLSDARIAELSFLADRAADRYAELLRDGMELYEILALTAEESPLCDCTQTPRDAREETRLSFRTAYDRAVFTDLWIEKLAERKIYPAEADFLPTQEPPETFTYVRNAYADEAYDVFSAEFSDPRVRYSQTFAEAVKGVLGGEYGYCLLPLAEKGGVRLSSVTDLLGRNDLKIASVTPVFGFSGDAELWYALVSRTFRVPKVRAEDDRYLEIRCSEEEGDTLAALLTAAEVFDTTLYRVHTVTRREGEENGVFYTAVFRTEGKSFAGFLAYLTMYTRTYVPVGIYRNLE